MYTYIGLYSYMYVLIYSSLHMIPDRGENQYCVNTECEYLGI